MIEFNIWLSIFFREFLRKLICLCLIRRSLLINGKKYLPQNSSRIFYYIYIFRINILPSDNIKKSTTNKVELPFIRSWKGTKQHKSLECNP